jgi:hypothetical protein
MHFFNHKGILYGIQCVILHKTLTYVYQSIFSFIKYINSVFVGTVFMYKVNVTLTLKSIRVIYWPRPMYPWSLKEKSPWVAEIFYLLFASDQLTLKIHRDHLQTKVTHVWGLKVWDSWFVKLLIGNRFYLQGQYYLDPWFLDIKTNRHIFFAMYLRSLRANHLWIFNLFVGYRFLPKKVNVTLTFDPLALKSKGVIYWPRPMYLCSMVARGPSVAKFLIGNRFYIQAQYHLNLSSKIMKRSHWNSIFLFHKIAAEKSLNALNILNTS